jgi:hypothetical protein
MKKYDEIMGNFGYRRILSKISAFDYWYVHPDLNIDIF